MNTETRIKKMIKNAKEAATKLYSAEGSYPNPSAQQYTIGKAVGMELALAVMKGEIAEKPKRVKA